MRASERERENNVRVSERALSMMLAFVHSDRDGHLLLNIVNQ